MIGHVEGVEAGAGVSGQRGGALNRIQICASALHVGDLPQAGDDAGDFEAGCEGGALREQ
jgi:hypothetical protein